MAPHTKKPAPIAERQVVPVQKKKARTLPAVPAFQQSSPPIQKKENNTGLPDHLKSGIENLSGFAMDDVKVHYNSDKPAQLNALAYAQGNNIHVGAGQEKHLPHEAWHVVQQKQGRVQATMQMKGIGINDDSALEKEADVMGGKAIQMVSKPAMRTNTEDQKAKATAVAAVENVLYQRKVVNKEDDTAPVQMKVNAGTFAELLVEQKKTAEELEEKGMGKSPTMTYEKKVIPIFDKQKLIQSILKNKIPLRNDEQLHYFLGIYNEEKLGLQADQKFEENQWGEFLIWLAEKAGKKHVTAGFEFEFSTMADNNPFQGVPHVEIAASQQKINGKSFLLETDASNALELVTPPFWLEAINNETPLPDPADVRKIDDMIKLRLNTILTDKITIGKLVTDLGADPGLIFTINNAQIEVKNLSDRSINHGVGRYNKDENTIEADKINAIEIGKITKFASGNIDTQINIATDAVSYMALAEQNLPNKETNKYLQQFYDLQAYLEHSINASAYEKPLSGFLQLFIRNIAGQLAVPAMEYIQTMQEKAYNKEHFDKGKFPMDAYYYFMTSSVVKDIGKVWIKDNIFNIGAGILKPDDWLKVLQIAKSTHLTDAIKGYHAPIYLGEIGTEKVDEKLKSGVIADNMIKVNQHYKVAKSYMLQALQTAISTITTTELNTKPKNPLFETPEIKFMRHNPGYISPRQDTHVPPDKVNLPAWKQRLHVTEIRSEPAEPLELWIAQIAKNKKAEEAKRTAPPWQLLNDYLKSNVPAKYGKKLNIQKNLASQFNVTMAELNLFKTRVAKMISQNALDKCIAIADPIAFEQTKSIAQILATNAQFSAFD